MWSVLNYFRKGSDGGGWRIWPRFYTLGLYKPRKLYRVTQYSTSVILAFSCGLIYDISNIWAMSRESVVGIATGYWLDDRGFGVLVPVWLGIFSTLSRPDLVPTQPPIQWTQGALSLGAKRLGREVDHSPPASAEVRKIWIYTSTHPYAFTFF
jgi:hypothetical protein